MEEEKQRRELLTPPVNHLFGLFSGRLFGLPVRNVLEAGIFTGLVLALVGASPLRDTMKLMAGCMYGIPVFVFSLLGVKNEDLVGFVLGFLKRKVKGSEYYLSPPIKGQEEKKEKPNLPKRKKVDDFLWRLAQKLEE